MLIGSKRRKFISGAILLIIAFLIHVQSIKSNTDQLKLKPRDKDSKKVHPHLIIFRKEEREMSTRFSFQELKNY
jgi:hypothetical protein